MQLCWIMWCHARDGSCCTRHMTTSTERIVAREPRLANFVRGGRLSRIPRKPSVARLLYAAVADQFPAGTVMSETEVNNELRAMYDDVATLRRALVDAGLLRRTPDGLSYERAQQEGSESGPAHVRTEP